MPIFTKYFCSYRLDENNTMLLNTLTSAIDVVNNDTIDLIDKLVKKLKDITSIDKKLYDKLKQRGYIFESEEDEKNSLNKFKKTMELISEESYKFSPIDFTICPTTGCNLRCTYCFEEEKYHENLEVISEKKLETIFKYIKQRSKEYAKLKKDSKYKKLPNLTIKLFGGEPLLKNTYPIVKKIFEFADQNHIGIYVITNGTNINDMYFELLNKYNKMTRVQITLDGCKNTHDMRRIHADGSGSFDQVCEGIQKVLDSETRLDVRINVDKENIYKLNELKELFENRDWLKNPFFNPYSSPVRVFKPDIPDNIIFCAEVLKILTDNGWYGKKDSFLKEFITPSGIAMRFFDSSNKELKPWKVTYCEATSGRSFCFAPNGTISTCFNYVGCKDQAIGHFDENGVTIDKDKLRKWTHRSPFNIEKCKDCKFILFCGGGCPAESIERGDINCPSCNDIEKTLETYAKHMKDKLLAKKH